MSYRTKKAQSAISAQSMAYLDALYESYLIGNKASLNAEFIKYFDGLVGDAVAEEQPHRPIIDAFKDSTPRKNYVLSTRSVDTRLFDHVAQSVVDWYIANGHYHA